MKKIILFVALGALSASAAAQTQPSSSEVRISGPALQIALPPLLRNAWPEQFDQVAGTYYLSNGKTMQLSSWGNRMYAKVDGMDRAQLVAASPYEFVGLDRQIKIAIRNPDGVGPIKADIVLVTPGIASLSPEPNVTRLVASR